MADKIKTNSLKPNAIFMVTGRLKYSRVASFIDGEELRKDNERAKAGGRYAVDKPHTKATICDAQVPYLDPNNKTREELYAEENLRPSTSNTGGYTGNVFYGVNKGNRLPWVGIRNADQSIEQIKPEGELANDQIVTLVLRVFPTSQNWGIAMDGIIVENPPVQYYMGSSVNALAERGIVFKPLAIDPTEELTQAAPIEIQHEPVAPPVNNAYSTQAYAPQQQQAYQPQQPQQPQPQQQAYQPQQQQTPQAQPFTPVNNQNQGNEANKGIQYNPNERQY